LFSERAIVRNKSLKQPQLRLNESPYSQIIEFAGIVNYGTGLPKTVHEK